MPRRHKSHHSLQQLNPLYSKLLIDNEVMLIGCQSDFKSQMESGSMFKSLNERKGTNIDAMICPSTTLQVMLNFS
jgi:hypothetical protein